jgi:hypothetical protein
MNQHIHVRKKTEQDCERQYPAAHFTKTVKPCPSDAYMGEERAAHSHGRFSCETREERAKHGYKPSVIVQRLPEQPQTKAVADEVKYICMAEWVGEMTQY